MDLIVDVNELFIEPNETKSQLERAKYLPSLELSKIDLQWVQVLSEGWASPLKVICTILTIIMMIIIMLIFQFRVSCVKMNICNASILVY